MRHHLLESLIVAVALLCSTMAFAQDAWDKPLEGFPGAVFGDQKGLGVLLVTPQTDEATLAVEVLIRAAITKSGLAELVMDDAPLGDISQKSDDEILAAARKYPVDVIVLVRTFPGADGPSATVWIESKDSGSNTFRMQPGGDPPWAQRPPPNPVQSSDPTVIAASNAADFGRQEAAMTRMGAIGLAETVRLIAAEQGRRILALESDTRSPVVRDPDGDVVPWAEAYTLMDRADLAQQYRRRRVTRTATMAGGAVLAAAGLGLLFVGLANQANCGGGGNCARPFFVGGGLAGLALGVTGISVGLVIRPQPASNAQLQDLVDEHNTGLR
jgi:hypothetical protein